MNEAERINQILNILYQQESVTSESLEKLFNVSPMTIRRDLQKLYEKGLIVRYRGGAMLARTTFGHEPPLHERETENLQKKRAIVMKAANLIKDGEVIVLDVGSTTIELAKVLRNRSNITVFTASLTIANIFLNTNVTVYLVGGVLQHKENCLGGPVARGVIRQYHFDKFFLGAAGVSENSGLTDFGMDEVETKKAFIERSKEVIALTDSSKFGKVSFTTICKFNDINHIITDCDLDPQMQNSIRKKGVNLIITDYNEELL
ncbi:DeoR/GlpR family DNA-binding transcription regulator [Sinanaerobacter chloroacetimidivorans]|uniref:DeoR/GlpR transcriptional regulator n=1 Tax=Sinanaerobacter chloroacetimidivorans TaxID=2818044 RepID=A0A8J7W1I0_9FIRM|nr:DeoR/GlpR family DNA-binding transcription regulator [Sinanaerobacter chloroacetimidivorans]MBR0599099.1 DeoR/GlpR transcriptional regulator [Sinanaerobacter chloroacetimidivorans]